MQPHPYPALLVHTTEELEDILNEPLTAREQLHAWPLSLVELLTTESGRRFVYKVQREPTVEAEFYARARTSLLPECTVLQRDRTQAVLLLPFLTAPTLRDLYLQATPEAPERVARAREIVRQIGGIRGDLPLYRDLGTASTWRAFVAETVDMLTALIAAGAFTEIPPEAATFLTEWSESPGVLAAIEGTSQLVNGDLKAEHIFLAESGYQIIDWQRPYRAPADVDLALLLESLQIPVAPYVAPAVVGVRWLLLVHWALEAGTHLLPDLPFFERWAQDGIARIRETAPAIR